MTIKVYTGRPGVGKTLTLVDELYRLLSKEPGFKVFSNVRGLSVQGIEIIDFNQFFKDGSFLKTIPKLSSLKIDGLIDEDKLLLLKQCFMCFFPVGSLVLIDEIQNLYPSSDRRFGNLAFKDIDFSFLLSNSEFNGQYLSAFDLLKNGPFKGVLMEDLPLSPREFFEKHRHYGYNIYGTCQNPNQLIKLLRAVVQELIYIQSFPYLPKKYITLRMYRRKKGLEDGSIGAGKDVSPWIGKPEYRLFYGSYLRKLYNSYQSEMLRGLDISTPVPLKSKIYAVLALATLVLFGWILSKSLELYFSAYKHGIGPTLMHSVPPTDKTQPSDSQNLTQVSIEKPPPKKQPTDFLKHLITNYEFLYSGYMLEFIDDKKFYRFSLTACKDNDCISLDNSLILERIGINFMVINACLLRLRSRDAEVFIGCKQERQQQSPLDSFVPSMAKQAQAFIPSSSIANKTEKIYE